MPKRDPEEVRVDDISPDADDEVVPFTYAITAYGADYPVDSLVKRLQQGDIIVPDFQRGFVWTRGQADRFVESLLLGLPVPGIFLAVDDVTRKLLVVDGQQRLTTLLRFYEGLWEQSGYALHGVQRQFVGSTYARLPSEDRRRLDDSILHATVLRQDEPSDDQSSIYFVFERLNTGGTPLQPQEIRNSIYRGPFRELLDELNSTSAWRLIYGPPSARLKDREMILRFFAMRYDLNRYARPMKAFLNAYMGRNRSVQRQSAEELRSSFLPVTDHVAKVLGPKAFRIGSAINAAVLDSVMVGLASRLDGGSATGAGIRRAYDRLLADAEYSHAVSRATADEESVRKRMSMAAAAFANIE